MVENIVPLHIIQIKRFIQIHTAILKYSENNKQLFGMVSKWLTIYLANYVINQWPTAFGPMSNPSVFELLYLVKFFGGFEYFPSHDINNMFKNTVILALFNAMKIEYHMSSAVPLQVHQW